MKQILLVALLGLLCTPVLAQKQTVTGYVSYPNGAPAAGCIVKGKVDADLTDREGDFTLTLDTGYQTLFIGRADQRLEDATQVDSVFVQLENGIIKLPAFDSTQAQHWVAMPTGFKAYVPPPPPPVPKPPRVIRTPSSLPRKNTRKPPKNPSGIKTGITNIGGIEGVVKDESGELLLNASIQITERNIVKGGTVTDLDGRYLVKPLFPGHYDIKVTYYGYVTELIEDVVVVPDQNSTVNITMTYPKRRDSTKGSETMKEVMIRSTCYIKPLIEPTAPGSRSVLTAKDIEKMPPVQNYADYWAPYRNGGLNVSGGRAESTVTKIDGTATPAAKAGKLTSGEVNDFSKWDLWTGASGTELFQHSQGWNLRFKDRYTVRVKGTDGSPQANIQVTLKERGSGKTLWQAKTDNTGTAELWRGTTWADTTIAGSVYAEALVAGQPYTLQQLQPGAAGQNILEVPSTCTPIRKLDISFIVDATGSMQDEIDYLKVEIDDILRKAGDSLPGMDIRTASVFYRDLGDEYVVKSSPFVAGVAGTQSFISAQWADDGGDTPEAVDLALRENLNQLDWREDAHRIAFLVLDAPPHNTPGIQQRLNRLTREYAAQGIRLIPVACSGVDKSTEALLRNLALATNGTYVFLTDHSGIGGSHLAPTTDQYDVTYLNGLLYRIIYQCAYMPSCEPLAEGKKTKVSQSLPGDDRRKAELNWTYYPNPTTGVLHVRYEATKGQLYVADVSGRVLLRQAVSGNGRTTFDLSDFPSGIYFLRFEYDTDQFVSGRFVVSH